MYDYLKKITDNASTPMLLSVAAGAVFIRALWELIRTASGAEGILYLPGLILSVIFLAAVVVLCIRQNVLIRDYSVGMLGNSLTKILFICFALVILPSIVPVDSSDITERHVIGVIFSNFAGAFAAYGIVLTGIFLLQNISFRQARAVEKRLFFLGIAVLAIGVARFAERVMDKDISPIPEIAIMLLIGYFLAIIKTSQLVASITKEEKIRIIWLSMLGCVIAFIASARFGRGNELSLASEDFFPILDSVGMIVFLWLGFFLVRLLLSTLAALPTTRIVEQRSSEASSLVYLSRLIAESADFDKVLQTVTQLAQKVSRSTTAWLELQDSTGGRKIQSYQNISPEQIEFFHGHPIFSKLVIDAKVPVVIESVAESEGLEQLAPYIAPLAQSIVIIPLFDGANKMGSLIVTHSYECAFEPETVRILTAFADNVNIAIENTRLWKASVDKERYERELQLARQMQKTLLPQKLLQIPGYDVSARSEMAQEVGGDYYDVLRLRDGRECVLIGDVSGKGIAAAFIMAKLQGVVLSLARNSDSPKELLERINATLFGNMERPTYITLSCVSIEREPGLVTIARAGHTPALIRQGNSTLLVTPQGLGIGLTGEKLFNRSLEQKQVMLQPGDSLLLITDGINERYNQSGRDLGYDNLLNVLRSPSSSGAESIISGVFATADDFAEGVAAHDDMTALALFYKGLD